VLNSRIPVLIQALVSMLKVNMSIHHIHFKSQMYPHYMELIPYLEKNVCRSRLLAIQKSRPFPYRVKVLGRALLATRSDPNRFWMLLSGNAEIVSATTANLLSPSPSPATAAATSNAAALPAAVTGAANVAAPTACLKRKARP
jgi:hypothetical protein